MYKHACQAELTQSLMYNCETGGNDHLREILDLVLVADVYSTEETF